MIALDELDNEIAKLQGQTPTYQIIERLASLYIVREHLFANAGQIEPPQPRAASTGKIEYSSGTEFARAINGRSASDIWPIMDELMSTLQAVLPRLYDGVMRMLVG